MKVALVRARYNLFGGAERFVENAVGALAAEGASLTIITRQWPNNASPGVAHVALNPRYVTSAGRDRSFAEAVQAHISQTRYDLVQSHERIAGCDIFRAGDGVHAEWLTQRARISGLMRRLGVAVSPHHRYVLRAEREMFASPKLRAIICNSAMVQADVRRHFDVPAEKLVHIPTGVDTEKFHPRLRDEFRDSLRKALKIPKTAPVALFVGSGFERKGLVGFLMGLADQDGHARLTRESARGIVVGTDKHLVRFQALADQLGLNDRVRFVGGVADVRPYYAAADIFALPTLYDPMPNACLEAMACGLPVVTSHTSGAAELITPGVEGFLTDALETPAIADAMSAAFDQVGVMGAAARAKIEGFTTARMAAEYVALYRRLMNNVERQTGL
jgi:UDP-glucose:(heptosyl)LPS alpha-1,3-glucosyltransferase